MSRKFRHIIRILGTDIDGTLKVPYTLKDIKGVGLNLAKVLLEVARINPKVRAGFLTESEVKKIEEIITDPNKFGVPSWFLNRRKEMETGKDIHLLSADLLLRTKMDIEHMKATKTWRGYRHAYGLKVRGQRTKTTGRRGKVVGVRKKTTRMRQ